MGQNLLTVRADGDDPPPPYDQPDGKMFGFFTPSPMQSPKNLVGVWALPTGKFLRVWKV